MVIVAAIAGMGYQYFLAANIKTELYPNGNTKSVTNMIGQTPQGVATIYFDSSVRQKSAIYNYVDGQKQGLSTTYHGGGRKKSEVKYKDDKKNSVESQFSTAGRKIAETNYVSGVEGNTTKWSYHSNSTKSSEREFLKGVQINAEKTWHSNGKDKSLVSYVDGKRHGLEVSWHDNTQKASEINHMAGIRDGSAISWDAVGNKISEGDYKNGKINKNTVWTFHENKVMASMALMVAGVKEGSFQAWHSNGNKSDLVNYKEDNMDGQRTQWHQNNIKAELSNYVAGKLDGEVNRWDEQENLIEKANYLLGVKGNSVTNIYATSGNLLEKKLYENDILNGQTSIWFETGERSKEINYLNGEIDGQNNAWNIDGNFILKSNYINGERGEVTESTYYKDGNLSSETNFINKSKEGLETKWYRVGQKESETNYKNNKKDGNLEKWHKNGQKSSKAIYINGRVDGISTYWHPNGVVSDEYVYSHGKLSGLATSYTDKGVMRYQNEYDPKTFIKIMHVTYEDGKKHGLAMEKYPNGNRKSNEEYVNGDNINTAIWYQGDGETIKKIVQYQHKKKQFEKTVSTTTEGAELVEISAYIDNNTKSFSMKMVDGALDGEKIDYFANGTLMSVLNFKDGELSGDFLSYHANGNLQVKGQYVAGVKVGLFQEYYSANQKLSEITYNESGELHGTIKYWRKDGSLTQTLLFESGYLNNEGSESKIYLSAPSGSTKEIEKDNKGMLTRIYHHRNKKRVGSDIYIGESGLKTSESNFNDKFSTNSSGSNYSLDGTTTLWYENGMKSYEGSFRSIKVPKTQYNHNAYYYPKMHVTRFSNPIGEHTWYRKDGSIEKILNYKAMKLNGLKTIFNESGLRKIVLNYKPKSAFNDSGSNYSLDGTTIKWHDNGIKSYEGSFRSIKVPKTQYNHNAYYYPKMHVTRFSNPIGEHTWYRKDGSIEKILNYKAMKLNGLKTIFNESGLRKIVLNYKPKSAFNDSGSNYSLDGTTIKWHDNGIKSYEGSFRSIKVPKTQYNNNAYYYPKSEIGRFSNPVGEHTWWQKNGSLKDKKDYKKGK